MLLTYEQIKQRLSEYTYYPGWEFELRVGAKEGIHLAIKAEMDDNFNPGKKFPFCCEVPVPPMVSIEALDLFMDWRLGRIATHESSERLQVKGECIVNPHRDGGDKDIL